MIGLVIAIKKYVRHLSNLTKKLCLKSKRLKNKGRVKSLRSKLVSAPQPFLPNLKSILMRWLYINNSSNICNICNLCNIHNIRKCKDIHNIINKNTIIFQIIQRVKIRARLKPTSQSSYQQQKKLSLTKWLHRRQQTKLRNDEDIMI